VHSQGIEREQAAVLVTDNVWVVLSSPSSAWIAIGHGTYLGGKVAPVNQKVTISRMVWMKSFRLMGFAT
jgi:hypothetical protein